VERERGMKGKREKEENIKEKKRRTAFLRLFPL
jgi:hypothetical protein